ncbi:hypothetical protein CRX69_02250 [Pseudomonas rhizophila]|uniref:Uncharacterized protein n=1 Tax=Pseudomonas rhizophila TaxID=2045200 RepID=A0ABM6U9K9_9PSED|nr:hypothetical protein CRX69_02250 [Pseudomonas rhizophila]
MSMTGMKDEKSRARNIAQKLTNSDGYGRKSVAHRTSNVGASLLAKGPAHSMHVLTVTPLSRASSLPQGKCNLLEKGLAPTGAKQVTRRHQNCSYPAPGSRIGCIYR